MNIQELAAVLKVDRRSIQRWIKTGMPCSGRGRGAQYDLPQVQAWRASHRCPQTPCPTVVTSMPLVKDADGVITRDEAERRKVAAEAQRTELKLAKERGQAIAIPDAARLWSERVETARAALLNAPGKIAQRAGLDMDAARRLRDLLTDEFAAVLRGLAGE